MFVYLSVCQYPSFGHAVGSITPKQYDISTKCIMGHIIGQQNFKKNSEHFEKLFGKWPIFKNLKIYLV